MGLSFFNAQRARAKALEKSLTNPTNNVVEPTSPAVGGEVGPLPEQTETETELKPIEDIEIQSEEVEESDEVEEECEQVEEVQEKKESDAEKIKKAKTRNKKNKEQ